MCASWPVVPTSIVRTSGGVLGAIIAVCLGACGSQSLSQDSHAQALRAAPAPLAIETESPDAGPTAEPDLELARFADVPCWFDVASAREIECGELIVPENWSSPESKPIHLPVVTFRGTAAREPIVFLNGGPGARSRIHTADEIRSWLGLLSTQGWTYQRDFIVLTQRGTNWTDSNLSCPTLQQLWRLSLFGTSSPVWQRQVTSATLACAGALAAGHDLSAYNTPQSARDVAALRAALGIEGWSLYAVSYGTRFALSLMKDHPAGLRSVVLDSVYPPGIPDPLRFAPAAFFANLNAVLDACALDAACRRIYRELDGSFEAAIQRLRAAPLSLPDQASSVVGPSALVETLFRLMYSSQTIGLVPEVVHGFAQYSAPDLAQSLNEFFDETTADDGDAQTVVEGAFLAIRCNDDHALTNPGWWARTASAHPLLREWILERELSAPCAHWPTVPGPLQETMRVASAIPTILLVGAFDPATPAAYAEFAAAALAHANLVKFPAAGHGVLGNDACAATLVEAFLDHPEKPLPTACLDGLSSVDFSPSFQMHARHMLAQGDPGAAEELLGQTLNYQDARLRPDDPGIAVTLNALGTLHHREGRHGQAADALKRALAINSKVFGTDSTEAGESAGLLALVYHDQGKTPEAASLYRRTLRILEREHGQQRSDLTFYRNRYRELVSTSDAGAQP
jgi:pimeloyl-ACP methyl ester carboxylesterase